MIDETVDAATGDSMWYYAFKHVLVGPLLRLIGRPTVEGIENFPMRGPAIIASNHLAVLDSFYLPLLVPRRIYFLAKAEYFTGTGLKGAFQRWFFTAAGQIPIDRSGAQAAAGALTAARRQLDKGELMGMYPEGTRSPDGRLYKGKTGLARIALDAGVPVIPVAMINTEKLNPPGTIIPRPTRVTVRFGKPLRFDRFEGMQGNRFIERAVTDEIMYELMQLSGQQYVDIYAASLKESTPKDSDDPGRDPKAA